MTWFLILWVAYACPGGFLVSGAIPAGAKPLACQARPEWALETRPERALKRAKEAGCGARVFSCRNLKCEERRVECPVGFSVEGL